MGKLVGMCSTLRAGRHSGLRRGRSSMPHVAVRSKQGRLGGPAELSGPAHNSALPRCAVLGCAMQALYLIECAKRGIPLPPQLPPGQFPPVAGTVSISSMMVSGPISGLVYYSAVQCAATRQILAAVGSQ
jgi:hypothetical protein